MAADTGVSTVVADAVASFRALATSMTIGEFVVRRPIVSFSAQQTAKSALAALLEHNITRHEGGGLILWGWGG